LRARLKASEGHIWPAGRMLCMPALDHLKYVVFAIYKKTQFQGKKILFIWKSKLQTNREVNFTKMFSKSFFVFRSQKHKRTLKSFFTSGICMCKSAKAACKMLVKSTLGVNLINILRKKFLYQKSFAQLFSSYISAL